MATKAEAAFGLDRRDEAKQFLEEVNPPPQPWMIKSMEDQLAKLGELIKDSPLKKIDQN